MHPVSVQSIKVELDAIELKPDTPGVLILTSVKKIEQPFWTTMAESKMCGDS